MAKRIRQNTSNLAARGNSVSNSADKIRNMHATLKQASIKLESGDLDAAEKLTRRLLQQDQEYLGAMQVLGASLLKQGKFQQAADNFLKAASEAPDDWSNFLNLGTAWLGMEKLEMADMALREALRLNPESAHVLRLLGETAQDKRDYKTATTWLRAALEREPKNVLALYQLAHCYTHLGDLEEATKILLQVHRMKPDWLSVLNKLHKMRSDLIDIDYSAAIAKTSPQSKNDLANFDTMRRFLETEILDRAGEHERAWELLVEANKAVHKTKREALKKSEKTLSEQLEAAKAITLNKAGHVKNASKLAPLFILGPSRSGKTTLEASLSGHPAVQRGFETKKVGGAAARAWQIGGLPNIKSLHDLPAQLYGAFAKNFYGRLKQEDPQERFVTETNPALIGGAAQLAAALPDARFVFITRDRDDLAVRIFMTSYADGNPHAYDLGSIFEYIDWYEAMVDVLLDKLGDRAIHVRYEELVADPKAVTNKVFKLCGLDGAGLSVDPIGNDIGAALPYKSQLDAMRKQAG
ncbi:MAG: sulfotransferase [Pseudomonadota bacterium]